MHHTSAYDSDSSDKTSVMMSDPFSSVKCEVKRRKSMQSHTLSVFEINFIFILSILCVGFCFVLLTLSHGKSLFPTI